MYINKNKQGVVLNGYDVVSYHECIQSPPRYGVSQYKSVYKGNIYYFRNQTNKDLFETSPEKYVPQYGGYCATAVSEGNLVPVDPYTFVIQDNTLYLFYNDIFGNNTLQQRQSNQHNRQVAADVNRRNQTLHHVGDGTTHSSIKYLLQYRFR